MGWIVTLNDCLYMTSYSKESAEELREQIVTNPEKWQEKDVAKYGADAFGVAYIEESKCWWNDPVLSN